MVREKVTIKNPTGLHLRPAGRLCDGARKYKSLLLMRVSLQKKLHKKARKMRAAHRKKNGR